MRSEMFRRRNVSERFGTRRNAVPTSERPISDRFGTRRNELVMSLVIEKPFRKRRNELVQALRGHSIQVPALCHPGQGCMFRQIKRPENSPDQC